MIRRDCHFSTSLLGRRMAIHQVRPLPSSIDIHQDRRARSVVVAKMIIRRVDCRALEGRRHGLG